MPMADPCWCRQKPTLTILQLKEINLKNKTKQAANFRAAASKVPLNHWTSSKWCFTDPSSKMKKPKVGNKPSLDGTKSSSMDKIEGAWECTPGLSSLAEVSWLQMLFLFFPQITPWSRKFRMAGEGGIKEVSSRQKWPWQLSVWSLFRCPLPPWSSDYQDQACPGLGLSGKGSSNLASNKILLHSTLQEILAWKTPWSVWSSQRKLLGPSPSGPHWVSIWSQLQPLYS